MKKSIVKVQWRENSKGDWKAQLFLATPKGFEKRGLEPGRKISYEITKERRCTGYAPSPGERNKCPEFKKISSGSQCGECRGKDIYSNYVRGDQQNNLDGEFSVYLAQISNQVKVGVTKTSNIPKRWVEQGADYATQILSNLSSKVALENEQKISKNGVTERIRKENKTQTAKNPESLKKIMNEKDFEAEITDINKLTVYQPIQGNFTRKGLLEGEIQAVKGQILSNGRVAMAMTSGKVIDTPNQKGLNKF